MSRVYNFSAGPAVLPEEVLKEVAEEMMDYQGSGMSVMEMSHRSADFQKIIDYFCAMDLWDAIKEMRRLSAEGIPFGFTFMSYDATARASKGVIEVRHARLLKREKQENHRDAEFVEAYLDLDTCQARRFYQPLLMSFNGQKVILQ